MIIGFAGKKQSGKDTAARMWQYFYTKHRSFQTGEKAKCSFADYLKWDPEHSIGSVKKSFASPIKDIVSSLSRTSRESLESEEVKKSIPESFQVSIRQLLKDVGDFGRSYSENFWIDRLFKDVGKFPIHSKTFHVVISDVRFLNEIKAIRERPNILIKIISTNESDDTHPSEVEVDMYKNYDYCIRNFGTLEELFKEVYKIMVKEQFIAKMDFDNSNTTVNATNCVTYISSATIDGVEYPFEVTSYSGSRRFSWQHTLPPNWEEVSYTIFQKFIKDNNIKDIYDKD